MQCWFSGHSSCRLFLQNSGEKAMCGPRALHQPAGVALAPKQQAPHYRETMVAQQALPVGPVPMPPSWEGVGNGELPPQVGGQRGEAEGLLFLFLPLLLHPKYSCSISSHLDGVGTPPHTLGTLGKPYCGGQ